MPHVTVDHVLLTSLVMVCCVVTVSGIGCFKCTSINHDNPECEDTFNNTNRFYEADCWASRRGRTGLFPGTECIKMKAEDAPENFTVTVRTCVVDDGGTNSETEIGRQSHCGWVRQIKYNNRRMKGCILSCDTDACNTAASGRGGGVVMMMAATLMGAWPSWGSGLSWGVA